MFPADKIKPVKRTLIVVEGMLDCMMLHMGQNKHRCSYGSEDDGGTSRLYC